MLPLVTEPAFRMIPVASYVSVMSLMTTRNHITGEGNEIGLVQLHNGVHNGNRQVILASILSEMEIRNLRQNAESPLT